MRTAAVVLAAGSGTRMGSSVPTQFMEVGGFPVLYYTLKAFQESPVTDAITVVTAKGEEETCKNIIGNYQFSKVTSIVRGGQKRVDSVYYGLCSLKNIDYVFIKDSARIFLNEDLIEGTLQAAKESGAALAAAPVRDTVKVSSDGEYVLSSPDRSSLWIAQTPQTFRVDLIMSCFRKYREALEKADAEGSVIDEITDDVSLVSLFSDSGVRIVRSSFWNMKITEPEDICVAEALMSTTKYC